MKDKTMEIISNILPRDWCKKKRTGLDLAMKMDAF